jgi:hypothetical protein
MFPEVLASFAIVLVGEQQDDVPELTTLDAQFASGK